MRHSERCALATRPRCVCTGCGGSLHGWPGYLARAGGGPETVRDLGESAERLWWERRRRHRDNGRRAPTLYLQRAGARVALAALVAWLADERATRNRIGALGTGLHGEVFDRDLRRYASRRAATDPAFADVGKAIVGHFWCDLLVEIARALDLGADRLDQVPQTARAALFEGWEAPSWDRARTALAGAALGFLWKCFQWFAGADPRALALESRVLAAFICPDPGGHPRVAQRALRPLVLDTLGEALGANLEPGWLWGQEPLGLVPDRGGLAS
ncbi:hypothetical protein [Nocardiopsis sp. FIRDI 009]|uniref:hypothetical protein n=1 Tax=Nocardiopsis sp. FIRDI 009 TaxID=714197 RepID=UPI00130055C3|nr:hypothetical protein [Nocardiopsis sp. FIRDI 009]